MPFSAATGRMRICTWHDLPSGGGRRAFEDHCEGLTRLGHELIVLCPTRHEIPARLPPGVQVIEVPLPEIPFVHVNANLPPARSVLAGLLAHERHYRRVTAIVGRLEPDVFWVNTSRRLRCPDLGRRSPVPALVYLQEPYRWFYESLPSIPWIHSPLRSPTDIARHSAWRRQAQREQTAAAGFDRILVNSAFSRESVIRAYGLDSHVCGLGIDVERFSPSTGARRHALVSVGAMMPEKRHHEVVVAVGRVPKGIRPSLDIVSNVTDPGYAAHVQREAVERGVDLSLHLAIENNALIDMVGTALALVYAPRLEPFGLAPLEASALETPVIGIAEGGVRETIVDGVNGLLVDGIHEMSAAIERLIREPGLAGQLGRDGRKLVLERWTVQQAATRLERQLLRVIEDSRLQEMSA